MACVRMLLFFGRRIYAKTVVVLVSKSMYLVAFGINNVQFVLLDMALKLNSELSCFDDPKRVGTY